MSSSRPIKVTNAFVLKEKKRNGAPEGVQSLHNKETYICHTNEETGETICGWEETPKFIQEYLNMRNNTE